MRIEGLKVEYNGIEVVRGLDLEIKKGECVGLVGESGCGKTTVGLSVTRLVPIKEGRILLENKDIMALNPEELRKIRGKKISYVFQDPFSSLNPVFTVYDQLKECLSHADKIPGILQSVGLEKLIGKKIYPHELSGGMQQRVMIAMAIASNPELLILDEPTTALDATIQNQILDLIIGLKNKMGLSILFISHDLKTVFRLADKIAVMYAGRVVEEGPKEKMVSSSRHPYTMGLIDSIPSLEHRKKRFNAIDGRTPLFSDLPHGCKFHPRCRFKIEACTKEEPQLESISEQHFSRCIRSKELLLDGANKGN